MSDTILNNESPADQAVVDTPITTPEAAPETTAPATAPEAPAPATTTAPGELDYSKLLGEGGGFADNWRDALPEDIRNEKSLDSIKTLGTLAKSYVNAQRAMGAKKLAIPDENSTPDEWNSFYSALGRPDKADDYKVDGVKLPEGIVLDDEQVKAFRTFAHEQGMSQKVFEQALAFDVQRVKHNIEREQQLAQQEHDATLAKLQSEYGTNLPTVIAQCNSAMQTFGLYDLMSEKNLLNNYAAIKALADIGSKIGEAKLKMPGGAPMPLGIQEQIDAINQNPDDPYFHADHPRHDARVAEMKNLMNQAARVAK